MLLKSLFISLVIFICFLPESIKAQSYPGTNIKGQVLTIQYNQPIPVSQARVDLLFFNGQQLILLATTFTDAYGSFFFQYVIPNNYTITINGGRSFNISVGYIDYRYYSFLNLPVFYI